MVGDIGSIELDREGGRRRVQSAEAEHRELLCALHSAQFKLSSLGSVPGPRPKGKDDCCVLWRGHWPAHGPRATRAVEP